MEPLVLPDTGWLDWLGTRVDGLLAEANAALDRVKDGSERDTSAVLELWNDADAALRTASGCAELISQVHPDAEVRTAAEQAAQRVNRALTERGLDRELFEVLAATEPDGLDEQAARLRELVLRDFRRAGVDRSEAERERLRAISERLTVLDQEFSRVQRDDVRSVRLTPDRLAGMPEDWIAAHPPVDGLVTVSTDYPDSIPFRTYARDAAARRELTEAFLDRGWPENDVVLGEMLDLRHEQATVLGYPDWPSYDTETKMIATSEALADFLVTVASASDEAAVRDHDVLLSRRRRDEPDASTMDAASSAYYAELVRRERFGVDAQEVRRYFDIERVRQGLLDVTGRLFALEYHRVEVPVWHPDVVTYDVRADGEVLGRIHLDLHPRDGKFKHAAQFDLAPGIEGRQLPAGALVCNFPRGLMEHSDVVTLFHEFGHLVHHVLGGRQHWARFSGVATEWDFVEAPSQMLEEWAWDADVLRTFALDAYGDPIPRELVARMRAGNDFGNGVWTRTQDFYAAVSYEFHRDRPDDRTARLRDLQARYDTNAYLPGTHMQASFGHLAGYTSAYYTYLWSKVIAKDLFSAFDAANLIDPDVAHRYRDCILVPGGTQDAAALVSQFLGRPFAFDAFADWLARVPTVPPPVPA